MISLNVVSVQKKRSKTVYLFIHVSKWGILNNFSANFPAQKAVVEKKQPKCAFLTSNFSVVKAAFFFSAENLFYWKIPAKVQDLAVSVGFWASTPAGIWSCLVYVRAHLVAKVRSLLLVGSVLGPVMLLGWTVGADPVARRSVCCLGLIMQWFHEGGVLSKRTFSSPIWPSLGDCSGLTNCTTFSKRSPAGEMEVWGHPRYSP